MSDEMCWTTQREADPRYDNRGDAWNPPPCTHAACDDGGDVFIDCLYRRMDALCTLDKGHSEPHTFDDDTVTIIEFPQPEAAV